MAPPARGHEGYLQFGREATYGTAVAATHRIPYISVRTPVEGVPIASEMMNNSRARIAHYAGPLLFETTLVVELWYESMLLLIDGLTGTATYGSNGGSTASSNPWIHSFLQKNLFNSYTMQIIEGNIPSTKCQRLLGAKIDSMDLEIVAVQGSGAIARVTLRILSKNYQTNQTPTAGLFQLTARPVLYHQATVIVDGTGDVAADVRLRRFNLSVRNHLSRPLYMSSNLIDEPHSDNFTEVVFKLQKEFRTKALLDAALAMTAATPAAASPLVTFNDGAQREMAFTCIGGGFINSYVHPVEGAGVVLQDVEWVTDRGAIGNAFGPLQIDVTNFQATIIT